MAKRASKKSYASMSIDALFQMRAEQGIKHYNYGEWFGITAPPDCRIE